MKKLTFIIGLLLVTISIKAQSPGDDYAFTSDFILEKFNSFTLKIVKQDSVFKAERGQIFTIKSSQDVSATAGAIKGYTITFWKFTGNTSQVQKSIYADKRVATDKTVAANDSIYKPIDKAENGIVFFISDENLKKYATNNFRKPKGLFKVDGVVLPIKLRFGNSKPGSEFDFSQSVSLGPALSFTTNYGGPFGKSSFSILTGLNVTNVSVDANTVANNLITSKTTLLGLSPFVGFNADYQGISITIMGGLDVLPGQVGRNWAYRDSPWIGIGIGGSLFSTTAKRQE